MHTNVRFDVVTLIVLTMTLSWVTQLRAGPGIEHVSEMHGYAEAFDLGEGRATERYKLTILGSNAPGHIFRPEDKPTFRFQIENTTDQPLKAAGKLEIIRYAQRGVPGDWWVPRVEVLGDAGSVPVRVDMEAGGWQNLMVDVPLPQTRGGYALILDLDAHGRAYLVSCTRTFAHELKPTLYPKQAVDAIDPAVMERMGMQAMRWGIPYIPTDHPKHDELMAEQAEQLKAYRKHNVMVTAEIGTGHSCQPLGRGRPHLNEEDVMKGGKQDLAWLPECDDDYEQWVYEFVKKWGYPNGPVNGMMLWNEPWEGHSISGWQADMIRYRELYKRMGDAVMRAREDAGVEVLIGGCDSSSNTWDKLFGEGLADSPFWPKYLDFCSMHYEGLSTPALIKSWREREYYKGRVRLWDTESWMANTDDRYLAMVAATRAAGYDRVMGSLVRVAISDRSHGRVFHDRIHTEQGVEKVVRPLESRPLAAVYSASQHFIGDRSFREILFHHGLPWVFVFEGLESNPDDGTVVVVGDLSEVFHRVADKLLLSTVRSAKEVAGERGITEQLLKLAGDEKAKRRQLLQEFREDQFFEGAKLTIDAGEGAFQLYDYYGNAVPSSGDTIEIPLAGQGYFLRADPDKPGSFERLIEALREARVEGIEPAEIIPHDMTEPIDREPTLRLRMTNVLERPVSGELTVKLGGLEVSHPQELTLTPRRQTWVDVKVTGGEARADNTYPLSVVFDAGRDGRAVHHEDMHVNWVSRRTIAVDGKLDDWRGVLPQSIVPGESGGATLTEQMWLPFEKLDADAEPGAAIGYVAHDDEYFYFAAKIVDSSKHPGTVRFAERDEDAAFYPEISYAKKKRSAELEAWHWPEGVRRFSYRRSPLLPSGPPWFDNVMIGFNALPLGEDPKQLATLPGIPMRFTGYDSIDYEYALNPVAEEYGGGTEIWRMQTPKLPRKHYYPRQPEHPAEGPVTEGKLKIWYEGNLRFVEAAIPWSELPHVKRKRDAGRTVKFSYRVNDDGGKFQDLGMGRSVIEGVGHSFHPDWRGGNHVLLDFGFER